MLLKFSLFALACFALTFAIAMLVAAIVKTIGTIVKAIGTIERRRDNGAAS